ncbi:RPN1-RPN2-N domain-containing protein [Mycena indigotica]|uniref:RPN1-RPN2-N domain-containing protein n=1 Tax=Mycena indigotica TaxID=2126181 RepID=A0A8H6W8P3_9AGAR|nr:RPN1-RPN2-N domain-containing protein [Mycena indigotica]KAF7303354.1 RPN1-RPN2-N domain-containing protein [Mycena indigotica]
MPNTSTAPEGDYDIQLEECPQTSEYQYVGASQTREGGKGFTDWVEEDQFNGLRTDNLFYPFVGDLEWEFSDFLAHSSLTMKEINELLNLKLVRQYLAPHLSYKTAKELRHRIELLPTGPRWHSRTISYPGFPTKKPIVLFYRNSLECIQLLLRNPLFKNNIDFVPTQLFQSGERIHKEWINSDSAWKMQEAVPPGHTVLGVIASSDKTNISVMNGDRVAHPFLLSLANLHSDIARKASNHAFLMAALLPVPKFLCAKNLRSVMESRLLHHCLDVICDPLKIAARDGALLSKSDGSLIYAHTPLVSYIVDTPEAADIACVKAKTSHLTTASHHTFGDNFRHPERTGENTWVAISSISATVAPHDVAAYQKASKAHSYRLNGVHLPFWRNWPLSTNPARFLTPEVLHHAMQNSISASSLIHPRSGVRHFKEGVTRLKQLGGREHRELERSFISIIAGAVPREVLLSLRALMDFRFIAQSPQISETTIARMNQCLATFHEHKQHIIDSGGREQAHFAIPKLEFLHSIVPSIRWAGTPMQYTADITEKAHSTQIKVPARTETNHRDYDPQIVRHLDRAEKLRLFGLYTGIKSEKLKLEMMEDDNCEDEDEEESATQIEGPSLIGESSRPARNLFKAADLYPLLYPQTESRFTTTASAAFLLNRRPAFSKISIEDVAQMYQLNDLRVALGDFYGQIRSTAHNPFLGGRRRQPANCELPFTHLEVWYSLCFQGKAPHTGQPLPSQLLFGQPSHVDSTWSVGRYDSVLLSNSLDACWPGKGFRDGLRDHTAAQIRLIMRPHWPDEGHTGVNPFLIYAQRFDVVPQPTPDKREATTGQFILRRALRADSNRMGGVVDMRHIRAPIELIPRFGAKADGRLTPFLLLPPLARLIFANSHDAQTKEEKKTLSKHKVQDKRNELEFEADQCFALETLSDGLDNTESNLDLFDKWVSETPTRPQTPLRNPAPPISYAPKAPIKDKKQDEETKGEELPEDQQLKSELEMLAEQLKEINADLYKPALKAPWAPIRTFTSSIPKPLKFLHPLYPGLQAPYETWEPSENKSLFAYILSVLAMTYSDTQPRGTLRLLAAEMRPAGSPLSDPGSWGHEYVRHLAAELGDEYNIREQEDDEVEPVKDSSPVLKVPGTFDDLRALAKECAVFLLDHNAEPDAIDLLQELEMVEESITLVDKNTYTRVCQYLIGCVNLLPPPDDIAFLRTAHAIYARLNKFPEALGDQDLIREDFNTPSNPQMKRQLAFILARAQIPIEWLRANPDDDIDIEDEFPEGIRECLSNTRLSTHLREFGKELGVTDAKSLEEVNKTHLENTRPNALANVDTIETLKAIEHPIAKTTQVIVEGCAFAGAGNVLKIQAMLHHCDEHIVEKKEEKKDDKKEDAATTTTYFPVPAMYPRFLITVDEELNPKPVTVRVGQALDVVGQAANLERYLVSKHTRHL